MVAVPFDYDYDSAPERYRLGMRVARTNATASRHEGVAAVRGELDAGVVLDVGCGDGVLSAAVGSSGPRLIGLDVSVTSVRTHPPPVVRADATRLPFRDDCLDIVTALNVPYYLPDSLPAVREAHRVLRAGGSPVVAVIARDDSPECAAY